MGGLAFTKGPYPLYTPRMPCGIYEYVRRNCHAILRELFVIVATPIEGPGKSDFGDIDIFVTLRKEEYFGGFVSPIIPGAEEKYPFDTIKELLGAERKIQERNNIACELNNANNGYLQGTNATLSVRHTLAFVPT